MNDSPIGVEFEDEIVEPLTKEKVSTETHSRAASFLIEIGLAKTVRSANIILIIFSIGIICLAIFFNYIGLSYRETPPTLSPTLLGETPAR